MFRLSSALSILAFFAPLVVAPLCAQSPDADTAAELDAELEAALAEPADENTETDPDADPGEVPDSSTEPKEEPDTGAVIESQIEDVPEEEAPAIDVDVELGIEHLLGPVDCSSPRAMLSGFQRLCNKTYNLLNEGGHFKMNAAQRAAVGEQLFYCIDLSEQPEYLRRSAGAEAIVCLKEILDRIELPSKKDIPGGADFDTETSPAPAYWTIPHTQISMVRITEGPRSGDYVFSADTVAHAQAYYLRVKHLPYKPGATENFYEWFRTAPRSRWLAAVVGRSPAWARRRVGSQAVWQWVGLLLSASLALFVMVIAYRFGGKQAQSFKGIRVVRYLITLAFPLAAMLVPLFFRDFAQDQLALGGLTLAITVFTANVMFLVTAMVLLIAAGGRVAELIIASPRIRPQSIDAQFIRLGARAAGIAAAVIVLLEGGRFLGIPLTTLLAGAGVGGLTIALAAQDMLKGIFGSLLIVMDKPFRVGERIEVKGYDGVVQEVGLRSTKIRLLTGHMVTIPNEEMARADIENITRRPHIRRVQDLALSLDTPPDKADEAVQIVRELLENHEGLKPDYPPRVYLNKYNRDSLNLRFFYWYHPPNYWDFLAFSEKLNLAIMRGFEAANIRCAPPTTTTYLEQRETKDSDISLPAHD